MNIFKPIYTDKINCQDCYKCIRACPVKAIIAQNNIATINPETCVYCGECVRVCPSGAKKTRNDVEKAKLAIRKKKKTIVSLAPSYVAEFSETERLNLVSAIKALGFFGVSETAIGAQIVNYNLIEYLRNNNKKLIISTACPSINELIRIYYPNLISNMAPYLSPALSHAKYLKKIYGDETSVIFIGPCPAKKLEAEDSDLIDAALTFDNFRDWLEQEGINLNERIIGEPEDSFIPFESKEGKLYPYDGGMIKSLGYFFRQNDIETLSFSGLAVVKKAFDNLNDLRINKTVFIEALACEGGCVNGSRMTSNYSTLAKKIDVISNYENEIKYKSTTNFQTNDFNSVILNLLNEIYIRTQYSPKLLQAREVSEEEIDKALISIGKFSEKDELNCGGCGYESCKDLAKAISLGYAEQRMCVSYNRQLAAKKANALMKSLPAGAVIVDSELKIIECNYNFASLMGEDVRSVYEAKPGLEGANLKKIFPEWKLFQCVLETGEDLIEKEIKIDDHFFLTTIFTIEKNSIVGAVIRDITEPSTQKEQIVKKAKEVIKKNLSTVQKIAFLLGENAAETEVILNSIIESFSNSQNDRRF